MRSRVSYIVQDDLLTLAYIQENCPQHTKIIQKPAKQLTLTGRKILGELVSLVTMVMTVKMETKVLLSK